MKRVNILVDKVGVFEDGLYVAQGNYVTGGLAVIVGDYSKAPRQESGTRLRPMSPETARRVAAELAHMADVVEDAMQRQSEGGGAK